MRRVVRLFSWQLFLLNQSTLQSKGSFNNPKARILVVAPAAAVAAAAAAAVVVVVIVVVVQVVVVVIATSVMGGEGRAGAGKCRHP